jgi:hypothetical protein
VGARASGLDWATNEPDLAVAVEAEEPCLGEAAREPDVERGARGQSFRPARDDVRMPILTCRTYSGRMDAAGRVWCSTCRSYVALVKDEAERPTTDCPYVRRHPTGS